MSNIVLHQGRVTLKDRQSILKQTPKTIWLTGLSASGKSTLAFALEEALIKQGQLCYVLDGDNIRHGLNKNLSFSHEDRTENIRRIAEVARLMNDAGLIVITAFISPYREDREMAKAIIGEDYFKEVYVSTTIEVCERRDPKGLYKKARAGGIQNFTGIGSPYEHPLSPSMSLDTSTISIEDCTQMLVNLALDKV
jgi:adenylyl-sulfate kinase